MRKKTGCLLIGHNNMEVKQYEKSIRKMGEKSGAYRDLNLNILHVKNTPYHLSGLFNMLYCNGEWPGQDKKKVDMFDTFSATLAYLGTYLHKHGITFDYVHSFQEEKETLARKLQEDEIQTIAVTTTYYVAAQPILEIMEFIKKYNKKAKIIVGGPFISTKIRCLQDPMLVDYLLDKTIGADYYVNSSQGEATLVRLIEALQKDQSVEDIENIYYKTADGYKATPILKEDNKLTANMVKWDLFPGQIGQYVDVRTSISCPFACAFCGFPQHAGKYQTADKEALEKELDQLDKIETLKGIKFIDDTFNVPPARFKEILRMMIKKRYKFKWISNFRAQFADGETVRLMKESGCEAVYMGIESGSNQILKNMNKAATVEDYKRGITLLNQYGIITFASFIIGFPGETDETVKETIAFIKESGITFFRVSQWFCEHITPIWQQRDTYNITGESFEWRHATMDSEKAMDWVEEIFKTIENPIWVPIYNFDVDTMWHLLHQGIPLEKIKAFLGWFNRGVRDKLTGHPRENVRIEVLQQLKKTCKIPTAALCDQEKKGENQGFSVDFDLD